MVRFSLLLLFICNVTFGWFSAPTNWDKVYIGYVNNVDVRPYLVGEEVVVPEAGTVPLALTVRVRVQPPDEFTTIVTVKLYYRSTEGTWTVIGPQYSDGTGAEYEFEDYQTPFGRDTIGLTQYDKGETGRIALYVSDGVYENWDPDTEDPGENGENSTITDQCVVSFTAHPTIVKPSVPEF